MKFYKRTWFWERTKDSLALLGPTGGVLAGKFLESNIAIGIGIATGLACGWIAIWFVDHNKNGFVDLFEEEKE